MSRKMLSFTLISFCLVYLTSVGGSTGEVSFFGSSHVSVRLQEASSSSDIYFRLRTRRSDSMLFLAAGRTDYCLLVLDAGRLKVHINLGAGETEIGSEAPFLLNDMKWHSVNLTRRGSQLTIQVDDHLTKANLPTRFHELNIHFGVWLGGLAGFNEIFLGNLPSFRGCMSHINYNGEDVLLRAKTQPGEISGVAWNCSEEFEAPSSAPFSLDSPSSYVISRIAIPRQGTVIKVQVRTVQGEDGLIFYVSGMSSRPDYLALQLRDNKVQFIAETGGGPVELRSTMPINDGTWHAIIIQVSPSALSLIVDNGTWTAEPPVRGGSRHLDVSEIVYLGGVEDSKRNKLRSLGLIDHSFPGCLQNFAVDSRMYGLPEVDVSRNISLGCDGSPCPVNSKTILGNSGSECVETTRKRPSSIVPIQVKPIFPPANPILPNTSSSSTPLNETTFSRSIYRNSSNFGPSGVNSSSNSLDVISVSRDVIRIVTQTAMGDLEIMRVSPIQVAEGDSVSITPRHLAITLDLSKFGIRESGILFKVSKPPEQGRVEVTSRAAGSGSRGETFALLDVGAGRVRYYHNGAENSRDTIELVLRLVQNTGFLLPAYLQDERVITLPVEITAVNDPPQIRLVPGGVLRLAEGTKIRLMPQVITSSDPDTLPEHLQFTLLPLESKGLTSNQGLLELSRDPGKPILSFTQADLEKGNVWYVDHGLTTSSKMALKVTDGSSVSPTAILRIETFPLRIVPEVNTGLEVANVMGTTVFLTSANLSFTSNAADQGLPIEYHVIQGPRSGTLQIKRTNGQWTSTTSFNSLELSNQGLRYLLQRPSEVPTEDEFTFHVSLSNVKVPSDFRFRLRILSLRLDQFGFNVLLLNETIESLLSVRQLEYRTFPLHTPDSAIKYTIIQEPRYGHLSFHLGHNNLPRSASSTPVTTLVTTSPLQPLHQPRLDLSSIHTFTQGDLLAKRVFYSFRLKPYSPLTDSFLFNVSTPHLTDGPFKCQIHHSSRRQPAGVTLKPLTLTEGTAEFITSKILAIRISDSSKSSFLNYNVTSAPAHGYLGMAPENAPAALLQAPSSSITYFSSSDVDSGTLFYQHDGSESSKDVIPFVAWSVVANFIFEGQLDIVLRGVNNNPPTRVSQATLSVQMVLGGSRRITPRMLEYTDDDWDTDRAFLKYSLSSVGNGIGHFYDRTISLSRPIFSWTQGDIDGGKLVFTHEGPESHGFLPFWVSDSKFTVNGTLEIRASPPWIEIVNITTLAGKRGSIGRLSEESLRIDTNCDADSDTIFIRILDGPQHGIIKMNGNEASNFSLGEMRHGLVMYENKVTSLDTHRDSFRFQAVVSTNKGSAESEVSEFEIALYPEVYWAPLNVVANSSVIVQENSSAIISQRSLSVTNPLIPASDILFTLTRPPRHGYLAIDSSTPHEETPPGSTYDVTIWDQVLINEGRLRYVQSEPNRTHDSMHFDVTNGVRTLKDLRIDFIVIPSALLLASNPVLVNEGSSAILNLTHLYAAQNYFADKLGEVRITAGPSHGSLGMISRPKGPLQTFPYKALQDGKIVYVHDGTETLHDHFVVVAQTTQEQGNGLKDSGTNNAGLSPPHTIQIKVVPANDEVPRVVNNTGTWVWAGSTTLITNVELAATDEDSDETNLVFYVVGKKGGFPALADQPETPLYNFTQEMINASRVIFNHKGEDLKGASFDFEVSDGLNEANKETFKISIRKPELVEYEGRVPLSVFPLTQAPLRPENLLVRSSDGREINFKASSGPGIGQLLIERSENKFSPVSLFSQTDVNNGKIFYQHLKAFRGQRANDSIRFTATSRSIFWASSNEILESLTEFLFVEAWRPRFITTCPENCSEKKRKWRKSDRQFKRYADPLFNITLEMDISVSGAALGGLQRYVTIQQLSLKEGTEAPITNQNLNLTAVVDFITIHHRGSLWRGGNPTLRLLLSEVPRHGWVLEGEGLDARRLRPGEEISLPLLSTHGGLRYAHDDSETHQDAIGVSLWFWTNDTNSSTWLLNMTLPVQVVPVNDQPFQIASPKGPIAPVVQEHWRKLNRNDLLTLDPDTPPAHIFYSLSKISHGRFVLLDEDKTSNVTLPAFAETPSWKELELVKDLPTVTRFTQADVDAGKVIFYHSGPVSPVVTSLTVTDGHFPASVMSLAIPVQPLTLVASQSQATPIRITQGNSVMTLSLMNLPAATNGHLIRLTYNITRLPLHGKVLLRDRISIHQSSSTVGDRSHATATVSNSKGSAMVFSHYDLLRGELTYVQTDLSVANDSFEVSAHYGLAGVGQANWPLANNRQISTSWLVNVVSVPLLKRVKEVRSFVKGFAVGGLVAPDESEFSASVGIRTTLSLAVLDASPLAAVTGANPTYEILLSPKYGQLFKITGHLTNTFPQSFPQSGGFTSNLVKDLFQPIERVGLSRSERAVLVKDLFEPIEGAGMSRTEGAVLVKDFLEPIEGAGMSRTERAVLVKDLFEPIEGAGMSGSERAVLVKDFLEPIEGARMSRTEKAVLVKDFNEPIERVGLSRTERAVLVKDLIEPVEGAGMSRTEGALLLKDFIEPIQGAGMSRTERAVLVKDLNEPIKGAGMSRTERAVLVKDLNEPIKGAGMSRTEGALLLKDLIEPIEGAGMSRTERAVLVKDLIEPVEGAGMSRTEGALLLKDFIEPIQGAGMSRTERAVLVKDLNEPIKGAGMSRTERAVLVKDLNEPIKGAGMSRTEGALLLKDLIEPIEGAGMSRTEGALLLKDLIEPIEGVGMSQTERAVETPKIEGAGMSGSERAVLVKDLIEPIEGAGMSRTGRAVGQSSAGRVVSRFSHEDVRRGFIIYVPDLLANDILPLRLSQSSSSSSISSMADEFIFKVLAPGVQPALGIAKFNIRILDRYYDEKTQNQIISDGSTDPATKHSATGGGDSFRDFTQLVTPHKDSLITVGIVVAGIVTITLFLIIGIRCTCVKKSQNENTASPVPVGADPKHNGGIGIIDGYTPSTTCTLLDAACQSDSDCSQGHQGHHHQGTILRPLLMSPLSPRSRHKVGTSHTGSASESGSWTSSGMRNEMLTPSVPQCRVVPLCSSNISTLGSGSDSGGYSTGGGGSSGNAMMLCPLLPPIPICDTFSHLPEEIDPPDGYGFTYGSITNSLQPPLDIQPREHLEEETHFNEYCGSGHPNSAGTLLPGGSTAGTLRRNHHGKNQYWV